MLPSGSLATQVMVELSSRATLEGEAVRLVITGGLLAVEVLAQAVSEASTKVNVSKIKANFFIGPPLNKLNKKIPSLCRTRGTFKLSDHASHPPYSAEALGKPEAGVLTSPNFGVTVGGTVPDSHRSCIPVKPSLTLGHL